MPRVKKQRFDHLSIAEREVVGAPGDYDWEGGIDLPARARPTIQFSVRVDPITFEALQALSRTRGSTFSDTVRDALDRFVRSGGRPALSNVQVTFGKDHKMLVQVAGGRAEVPTSRRLVDPEDRSFLGDVPAATS